MEFVMKEEFHQHRWLGKLVEELPTPVIVAEVEKIEKNLTYLSKYFRDKQCKLRPHFKSHKCVTLARQQIDCDNTVGITCAKLSEAEQLVAGGLTDVLIANQVIGMDKSKRVAELNQQATVRVAVDSPKGIAQLSDAAKERGITIGVLVEVDIGMNRGGVLPGKPTLDLVEIVAVTPGLRFNGLQSYEGHLVTLENYEERKHRVTKAMYPLLKTKQILEHKGYSVILSSGGTGTYDITGDIKGIDEVQCGSYVLMDAAYKKIRPEFECARFILTTVISVRGNTITTDVGLKGMGAEYAKPEIVGHPNAEVLYIAEEHTVIRNLIVGIGDKIRMIPPHGCTTNNLYSHIWISKNDSIIDVWPIEGHGCLE
jgi:D-serine deaminase-like pyridoxal phosphate-dependent protein